MLGKARERGFTLVELMAVVVIVGVLAAIAVYGVRKYLYAAKSSEAINMIGSIKSAQEAYKDETFTYLDVTGDLDKYYPQDPTGKQVKTAWGGDGPGRDAWRTLGVTTGDAVQFGYACVAGSGGDVPTVEIESGKFGFPEPTGPWYVVKAIGDLDGDGEASLFLGSSFTNEIYVENESE